MVQETGWSLESSRFPKILKVMVGGRCLMSAGVCGKVKFLLMSVSGGCLFPASGLPDTIIRQ